MKNKINMDQVRQNELILKRKELELLINFEQKLVEFLFSSSPDFDGKVFNTELIKTIFLKNLNQIYSLLIAFKVYLYFFNFETLL